MLLRALPQNDERDGPGKKVCKAEVLVFAKRHIMQLEREKRALEEQREELEDALGSLKRRFLPMGGIMPDAMGVVQEECDRR
jgi:hypothetical protein